MRTYTAKEIALPALLAALAGALTLVYVGKSGPSNAAAAATNGVYVATRDFAAGASGDEIMRALRLVRVPQDAVVAGAVTRLGQLTGQITLTPIFEGQQLTARAFGAARQQGLAGQLAGTMRAIQLAGDQNQVLAGSLRAGNRVDVVAALKAGEGSRPYGRTILRDVVVLKAPASPDAVNGAQTFSATLRVTDAQAQTLFFVTKNGDWSLVLRPVVKGRDSGDFVDSVSSVLRAGR